MKLALFTIFLLAISFSGIAQTSYKQDTASTKIDPVERFVSSDDSKDLLNKQFRLLMTDNSGTSFGSFASIDFSENKRVNFSPSFVFENGNILTGKVGAGYSDGFADLFKNSKLNTNVSIDVDYHFLAINKKFLSAVAVERGVEFDIYDAIDLEKKRRDVLEVFWLDSISIKNGEKRRNLSKSLNTELNSLVLKDSLIEIKILKLKTDALNKADVLNDSLEKIKTKIKNLTESSEKDALVKMQSILSTKITQILNAPRWSIRLYEDTLNTNKIKKDILYYKIDNLNNLDSIAWDRREYLIRNRKFRTDYLPLSNSNLPIKAFRFGWITLGAQIKNDAFRLFDSDLDFDSRITSKNFTSMQTRLRYTYFSWSDIASRTWYFSAGLTYNLRSNYQDLTSTEITVTNDYGTNGSEQMTASEKFNAYVGQYRENIDELIFSADYYQFFLKDNLFAIHIYPSAKFTEGSRPSFNTGVGILFPIQNKEKDKSVVNTELYWNLSDMFRTIDSEFKLYQTSKVGLRFSFPFNFINPNKK